VVTLPDLYLLLFIVVCFATGCLGVYLTKDEP
jgi:hypothetical protein